MGLDIVAYSEKKKEVLEISERLHKAIFSSSINYFETVQTKRLKDYYKTNVFLAPNEIRELVVELDSIKKNLKKDNSKELEVIIKRLSEPSLIKVHIAGD